MHLGTSVHEFPLLTAKCPTDVSMMTATGIALRPLRIMKPTATNIGSLPDNVLEVLAHKFFQPGIAECVGADKMVISGGRCLRNVSVS